MAGSLHGSARTTPRVRAELQASKEKTSNLAQRYRLSATTRRVVAAHFAEERTSLTQVSLLWRLSLRRWAERLWLRGQQPTARRPGWTSMRMREQPAIVEC